MRIARVSAEGITYLARIEADDTVVPVRAEPAEAGGDALRIALDDPAWAAGLVTAAPVAEARPLAEWQLEAPVRNPSKVIAIGLNYADHARESGLEPPPAPVAFAKLNNSICGPDAAIRYSASDSTQVDYEAELAVVIGRQARRVSEDAALSYVFGYTACNDVSARDAQFADGQWIRGKSFDTFCPLGPWIVGADEIPDPQSLAIACHVNGTTLQDGSTSDMIFGVAEIVSYLSRVMTLEPGDVIATGTPFGVGFARDPQVFLGDGDVVEVEIERIGTLRNPVVVE
ncbi:MAG TPA: fumarylacetoacetate hydrolase family protein [Ilumatobacter sp.]|nr:fumarylacetoacetate hydrolase family protein [Ilumatobacter sp.]